MRPQSRFDRHTIVSGFVAWLGMLHFALASRAWSGVRYVFWHDLANLPNREVTADLLFAVLVCPVLFAAFGFALYASVVHMPGRTLVLIVTVAITNVVFLFDVARGPQISLFGDFSQQLWSNSIYFNWPLYSFGPSLSSTTRLIVAVGVTAATTLAVTVSRRPNAHTAAE